MKQTDQTLACGAHGLLPRLLLIVLFCLLAASRALSSINLGGDAATELKVPVRAALSQATVIPGDTLLVAVTYDVPPDAHIQKNEFFFAKPSEGESFVLGDPVEPKGELFEGETIYKGKTTVYYALRVDRRTQPGKATFHLIAGHQACTEKPIFACFAPEELTLELPLEVVPQGAATQAANEAVFAQLSRTPPVPKIAGDAGEIASSGGAPPPGASSETAPTDSGAPPGGLAERLQMALARRSLLAFLLVFLGGIASSFTPCVYPMIPITISYIGGRSKTKLGGLFLSAFFVLGIALTYSILGVLAASSGALFGGAMQSPAVLLVVSAIFFTMGASMLGAFDLTLPSGMQTRLQSRPKAGVFGALFMGMVTGLVASPCVGPVVVVLLTWVAQIGSVVLGFLLLFTFALGLGMLFLVIGTFAGALNALPQAGGWMDTVKHFFGVILIGMGIYYVRPLIGPAPTLIATGVFVLLVGTFLGAFRPVTEDPPRALLFRKGFGIVLLLVGAFALIVGMAKLARIELRTGPGVESAAGLTRRSGSEGLSWISDDVAGLAQARAQGRPALIDFYADWCAACKELDEKTWSDGDVRLEGRRFVAIKLDLTKKNAMSAQKQADYQVPGLPTVILYDSAGKEQKRFFGFRPPRDVLAWMRPIK